MLRNQNSNISHASKEEQSKENARPKLTRAATSKRSALGNVTNQLRRQPQRIAKGKGSKVAGGQENDDPNNLKGGKAAFTIFEDAAGPSTRVQPHMHHIHEDEPMHDQENHISGDSLILHEAVVNFSRASVSRRSFPLAPIELDSSHGYEGSPMVLDSSRCHDISIERPDEFGLEPYFLDIYSYLRATECVHRPGRDYMNRQSDVTTSMRNILVDWLVEVGEEYKLQRETLFLAVAYIDRFLSLVGVSRPKLQLVGTTSMFIASKYEEIYPPDVAEFVYITDDTYDRSQVLKMESAMLKILDFKVSVPTINWFCERFLDLLELDMSEKAKFLSFFLAELSLIEIEKFMDFRPSEIAASCVPKHMERVTSYSLSDLKPCVELLFSQYARKEEMPQKAVVEKYKQTKFAQVSTVQPPLVLAIF
ncbi:unnamed protein product [Candidula unifasciata]|uniref:Cyclin A n=1 Tax=Candidula unifasciata TaxID=100452 RepID=A0A8S3Z5R0_9EUPU|nr:unnamed protein product [Candidula unifasciata]